MFNRKDFRPSSNRSNGISDKDRQTIKENREINKPVSLKEKRYVDKQLDKDSKYEVTKRSHTDKGYMVSDKENLNIISKHKTKEQAEKKKSQLDAKNTKASATNHSENLDYQNYVEYSGAKNKYVKVKNGYGSYEYLKFSDTVKEDGSSTKPIERNVLGYPTLYSEDGQKAYGFNKKQD